MSRLFNVPPSRSCWAKWLGLAHRREPRNRINIPVNPSTSWLKPSTPAFFLKITMSWLSEGGFRVKKTHWIVLVLLCAGYWKEAPAPTKLPEMESPETRNA